ncbi:MAG: class I SAM-dependent methyltransferase [Deltaproteobacteria bacterium]
MTGSRPGSFAEAFLLAIDPDDLRRSSLRVLDVGTGTARIAIEICKRQNGIDITGVDRSVGILRRARRGVAQAGLSDAIRIERGDACSLSYAAGSFDAVISNGLVHHVPDRRGVLCEMIRVLRPGGVLLVRDSLRQPDSATIARILSRCAGGARGSRWSGSRSGFQAALTLDEARDLASSVGLPSEWVQQTGPRHWLLGGRRGFIN